jgi:hypothetical protein
VEPHEQHVVAVDDDRLRRRVDRGHGLSAEPLTERWLRAR